MTFLMRAGAVAIMATAVGGLTAGNSFAGDCTNIAAVGTGITRDIASLMARQGVINIAESRGFHVDGTPKIHKCEDGSIATECTAVGKACKPKHGA